MQPLFTYNQDQAASVGAGQYITKSGGYDVKVVRAEVTRSQSQGSKAQFLELDLETREGQKCNYVSICFVKGDGTQLDFGNNLIQSIMGCAGVQYLTVDDKGSCNELLQKSFKAILQRVDFTKNNGQDGYKFELKLPALMSGQTIKEKSDNKPAQAFGSYAASIEDKDERQAHSSQPQQSAPQVQYNEPPTDFDDDIPF